LKPNVTVAPGASDGFQLSPVAVTSAPDWLTRADHAWVTR